MLFSLGSSPDIRVIAFFQQQIHSKEPMPYLFSGMLLRLTHYLDSLSSFLSNHRDKLLLCLFYEMILEFVAQSPVSVQYLGILGTHYSLKEACLTIELSFISHDLFYKRNWKLPHPGETGNFLTQRLTLCWQEGVHIMNLPR